MRARNPIICWDCGRKLHYDEVIAVPFDSKVVFLCRTCYQQSLAWVNPKKGAKMKKNLIGKSALVIPGRSKGVQTVSYDISTLNPKRKRKTKKAGIGGIGLLIIAGLIYWLYKRNGQDEFLC